MNPSSKTLRDHRPRNVRETDTGSASKSGGGGGGGNTSKCKSKNSATKNIRECACGRGLACVGMTQAFRLLGDPRCYYVELPRYRKNPPAYKYVFRNNLRRAYIRHLVSQNPSLDVEALENTQERRYVALHHFHPAVVKAFYENPLTSGTAQKHKVPISITEHELQELDMNIHQEDRILSISGAPTGGYYFCPGYPQLKAHEDLKVIIKKARARKEKMEQHDHEGNGIFVPENIEISNHAKGKEASKSPMKKQESTSPDKPGARTTQQKPDRFESIAPPLHSPKKTVSSVSLEGQKAVSTMQPPELLDVQHSSGSQDGINVKPLEKADSQNLVGSIVESGAPKTRVETSEVHKIAAIDSTKEQIRESTSILNSDMVGSYEHGYKEQFSNIVSEASNSDFDNLWAENVDVIEKVSMDDPHLGNQNNGILGDDDNFENSEKKGDGYSSSDAAHTTTKEKNTRDSDYPWETPKYRRHSEWNQPNKRISSLPAHFIDPNVNTLPVENESHGLSDDEVQKLPTSMSEDSSENQIMKPKDKGTPVEAAAAAQKSAAAISAAALLAMKSIDEIGEYPDKSEMKSIDEKRESQYLSAPASPVVDESRKDPPGRKTMLSKNTVASPARIQLTISESKSFDEIRSQASEDSFGTGAIKLQQSYPGVDPTLRIQVHNDLIAWESKRRSVVSNLLNSHGERWQTLQCILRDGLEEVKFAERFVNGFAKAGIIFADSTQAIYDDKLLDDSGNTVNNSFLQNRLYKKRNSQEYSIEAQDSFAESGQSALLNSILEAQVHLANSFRESSNHIEEEILPELFELRADIQASAREYETKGDSILAELKRSEIELRNIWDVFDAMVTGDLMEYTVHGSMHGSSQHGGSYHSSLGPSTGSMPGLMSPRDGEGLIVSSVNAPMVKSTFRQLGAVEDGWLVEMYYRSAVAYQQAVFGVAEEKFGNITKSISDIEERRFRRLHEVMLAFVPRQRRHLNALPEHFKSVLNDLVGLRIDEETLQSIIDNSILDRSRDHLKRGASHRSAIMNRSKISKSRDIEEEEIERIEAVFGNPLQSSGVLLLKVVELQPGGFMSMVNTSWRTALFVVTSEGNIHVFALPDGCSDVDQNPFEAFRALCPATDFDPTTRWLRKEELLRNLTPTVTLSMRHSTFSVPKMQQCHVSVTEEKPHSMDNNGSGTNRFMKVMKAAADSQRTKKCTFRLPSSSEVNEWINLLEQTKKSLSSKNDNKKSPRFAI